jgi:hypothetical protein
MAKDCPSEWGESLKKKADPARFAYTTIKALTKEQREIFMKMVMEDKDGEDFWINPTCGTTRLIWKKDLSQNLSKITIWYRRNKENWTNSWMKTWKKDIFDRLSRPKRHHSSLSRRRMEDFDHVKTIDTWMTGQLKTHILYP